MLFQSWYFAANCQARRRLDRWRLLKKSVSYKLQIQVWWVRYGIFVYFIHLLPNLAGSRQQHDANYYGLVTVPYPHARYTRTPRRGLRPLLFWTAVWVIYVPFHFIRKDAEDKANGLTSLPYDANFSTETRSLITPSMNSPVPALKTLVVDPAGVWSHDFPLGRPALSQQGTSELKQQQLWRLWKCQ